jgi:hypothetical protein
MSDPAYEALRAIAEYDQRAEANIACSKGASRRGILLFQPDPLAPHD